MSDKSVSDCAIAARWRACRCIDAFAFETNSLDATRGVILVGTDRPSVDPVTSQGLPSHQALLQHDLRVLENLVLDAVDTGDYELIVVPLKLM